LCAGSGRLWLTPGKARSDAQPGQARSRRHAVRKRLLHELDLHAKPRQHPDGSVFAPQRRGIRTKQHKLIFFYGADYTDTHNKRLVTRHQGNRFWKNTPAAWEFYDLGKDPREMHNRYRDPDYQEIIQTLKAELKELRKELGDTDKEHPRIRKIVDTHWNN